LGGIGKIEDCTKCVDGRLNRRSIYWMNVAEREGKGNIVRTELGRFWIRGEEGRYD